MTTKQRVRKTKVIATLGPACDEVDVLAAMIEGGMNVARLNFSHGSAQEHEQRLERLEQARRRTGQMVATMLDTRGIEIRVGEVDGGLVDLEPGTEFVFVPEGQTIDRPGISITYPHLAEAVEPGDPILIDDGSIGLAVVSVAAGRRGRSGASLARLWRVLPRLGMINSWTTGLSAS